VPEEPKKPVEAQGTSKDITPPPPQKPMDLIHEVNSLDDLKDVPVKEPDPIEMVWDQGGQVCRMKVVVKRPGKTSSAYAALRLEYLAARRKAETPIFDTPNAVARYPDEGLHNRLLRQKCIVSPAFLNNEGIEQSDVLPPEFWASLDLKLMPIAGLDGDFFYDWESLQTHKDFLVRQFELLAKSEGSSLTKSSNDAPTPEERSTTPDSLPTTNGHGNSPSSDVPSGSGTLSGSGSPPQRWQEKSSEPQPIPSSGNSSVKPPLPPVTSVSRSSQMDASASSSARTSRNRMQVRTVPKQSSPK
jgi:hypothetical protein